MDDDRRLVERRVLGFGLKTEKVTLLGTDVAFAVTTDGKRTFALVEGVAALTQDLTAAFKTGLGTDPLNLDFGFDGAQAIAQETNRAALGERLRASAAAVLVREPRVRQVVEVRLDYARPGEGDAPESTRPTDAAITCVFETVLGRREDLTIGEPIMSDDILLSSTRLDELGALVARSGDDGQFGFTEKNGLVPKSYQQLVAEGFAAARRVFGEDIDLANGAVLRKLVELNALSHANLHSMLALAVDDGFATTARGAALSRIGEELGFPRPYLRATGEVKIKTTQDVLDATKGVQLPRGTRLQTADGLHHVMTATSVTVTTQPKPVPVVAFYPGPGHNLDPAVAAQKIVEINLNGADAKRIVGLLAAANPALPKQFLQIEHTSPLTGGNLLWDDERYRELILKVPRSVWTPEAIELAVELVPGVARAVVADEFGGLDVDRPIFGNFIFGDRVFGRDRDIFSPYALKVHVVADDGAIWEGDGGLREALLAAIDDVRPLGVFADVDEAGAVQVAIGAHIVLATPPGSAFKSSLMARLDKYIRGLGFGEPVRRSRLVFAIMEDPSVVDVQALAMWRKDAPPGDYKKVEEEILTVPADALARLDDTDNWLTITT